MLRKHLISVLLMVLTVVGASAGTWKMHSSFVSSSIQNVCDAGDKVFYLNNGTLFQFDKATSTTIQLGRQNILSDNGISQIYYDWERDLLFVAYLNSNIDVIDGTGKVTNISNLKNLSLPVSTYTLENSTLATAVSKKINDITFANGFAYVAADYGFLLIDESTLTVTKNYHMGDNVTVYSSGCMGTELQYVVSGRYIYRGSPDESDPRNEYIKVSGTFTDAKTFPVSESSFLISRGTTLTFYDFSSGAPVSTRLVSAYATSIQKAPNGFIANFQGQSYYYTIDETGAVATQASTVAGLASSHPLGDGTVWICDANGLHKKGSTEYFKINSMTTSTPHWLRYNGTLDKLYMANSAPNKISPSSSSQANVINTYDGTTWRNATPYTTTGSVGYDFVFDPLDHTTYYRASWNKGFFKVTNDALVANYTNSNARIGNYRPYPAFDKDGNLWAVSTYSSSASSNPVSVLTRDKLNKTPAKADWFVPSNLGALFTGSFQRSRFLISKKNNVKIFSDMDYPTGTVNGHIICWDNDNDDPLVNNYHYVSIANFIDQNNKQVDWVYMCHFEEDHEGLIWVAHDMGVFILDPDVVFDEHPHVVRPYVTKSSEGKGYLCEGYSVYDVGVDRENNKWLASNDGLYHVSADGSEIFNHFTTENSDIPSNTVYSVECDTIHDRVYIYTDNGFAEYVVNGDAAALNFDNVYAFPSPVEPDYTGMIKIANLMENTYVTITDRDGNIITQMGPVMGSALWDGSGANGERVATGVYNIYAAQGSQPATTGEPSATVMIIR